MSLGYVTRRSRTTTISYLRNLRKTCNPVNVTNDRYGTGISGLTRALYLMSGLISHFRSHFRWNIVRKSPLRSTRKMPQIVNATVR